MHRFYRADSGRAGFRKRSEWRRLPAIRHWSLAPSRSPAASFRTTVALPFVRPPGDAEVRPHRQENPTLGFRPEWASCSSWHYGISSRVGQLLSVAHYGISSNVGQLLSVSQLRTEPLRANSLSWSVARREPHRNCPFQRGLDGLRFAARASQRRYNISSPSRTDEPRPVQPVLHLQGPGERLGSRAAVLLADAGQLRQPKRLRVALHRRTTTRTTTNQQRSSRSGRCRSSRKATGGAAGELVRLPAAATVSTPSHTLPSCRGARQPERQ